jgi:hypothetical protein
MRRARSLHSKIDRSTATAVEMHSHHAATTNAVPDRKQYTGSKRRSYRSIDSVSAALHHLNAYFGSSYVLSNNHPRLSRNFFVTDDRRASSQFINPCWCNTDASATSYPE